jgi:capsular polysaccharide biosynthesis protein
MDVVAERLQEKYPGIGAGYISSTLSMGSVRDTGVLQINCSTGNAQMSADICNAVVDVAPAEIIRVVSAGSIEIIDYAQVSSEPDDRHPMRNAEIKDPLGCSRNRKVDHDVCIRIQFVGISIKRKR